MVKRTLEFSEPLPPPDLLQDYNGAFAGCAERIVAMAERQSTHRQELERLVVQSNCGAQKRGQWFAFILALVVISGGVFLLAQGRSIEGFATIALVVGSLVGALFSTSPSNGKNALINRNLYHECPHHHPVRRQHQ
jgi:uncharacterized membrane protein